MVISCSEEARGSSTSVFRWNENAANEEQTHEYRPGLFTLTTENQITKKVPGKSDVADQPRWIRKLFHFVFIT
ncbi:hypothetical protein AB3S75_044082 [Citrus x aurantiifolia]